MNVPASACHNYASQYIETDLNLQNYIFLSFPQSPPSASSLCNSITVPSTNTIICWTLEGAGTSRLIDRQSYRCCKEASYLHLQGRAAQGDEDNTILRNVGNYLAVLS